MPVPALLWLLLLGLLGSASALTAKQKRLIVQKHNDYRSQPEPSAADMKKLSWDTTLEELATSYAEKCTWEHNTERGFRGENLFIMSGSRLDVGLGMAEWHQERDFYNFTSNTCQEGQMCGHYTQMVWGSTERVGCGEKFCEKVEGLDDGNMYLLVCNYEPPGNFQGEQPFSEGTACSACPDTHPCQGSLCVDQNQMESGTDIPDTTSDQTPETAPEHPPDSTVVIDYESYTIIEMQTHIVTVRNDVDASTSTTTSSSSPDTPQTTAGSSPDTPPTTSSSSPDTPQTTAGSSPDKSPTTSTSSSDTSPTMAGSSPDMSPTTPSSSSDTSPTTPSSSPDTPQTTAGSSPDKSPTTSGSSSDTSPTMSGSSPDMSPTTPSSSSDTSPTTPSSSPDTSPTSSSSPDMSPTTSISPPDPSTMMSYNPPPHTSMSPTTITPDMSPPMSSPVSDRSQLEEVLDVTPTNAQSPAVSPPQSPEDSSAKPVLEKGGGGTTDKDLSTPNNSPRVTTASSKSESLRSSPEAVGDKRFSNDGPDTLDNLSPALENILHVPDDKDHQKDSPAHSPTKAPTLRSLLLPPTPTTKPKKGQKDGAKRKQDTQPKNDARAAKQRDHKGPNSSFLPKKYQMYQNGAINGARWAFTTGAADGTYFGKQFLSPPISQTHRPSCPYPCLNSPFKFPLFRPNNPSPWGGHQQNQAWWPAKKPCKKSGYKSSVYSLYRPSNNMENNFVEPRLPYRFWR